MLIRALQFIPIGISISNCNHQIRRSLRTPRLKEFPPTERCDILNEMSFSLYTARGYIPKEKGEAEELILCQVKKATTEYLILWLGWWCRNEL